MGALREFNGNTHFMSVARHGGYVYFSETTFNGLFRYKEGENEAAFLGRFPNEDLWQGDLHREVFVKGDKLYFIPLNGHGISVYDCVDGTFEMLKVQGAKNDIVHFGQCVELEDAILLIPVNLSSPFTLLKFETGRLETIPEISAQIESMILLPTRYEVFSVYCAVFDNGCLYLAMSSTNIIFKISLSDYGVKKIILPFEFHLRYVSFFDGVFYFTAQEHLIVSWRESDNGYRVYKMPCEAVDVNYPYLKSEFYKEHLYVISGREDRLWKLNLITGEWINLMESVPENFTRELHGSLLFIGYSLQGNCLTLYPRSGNGELFLDLETGTFDFRQILYNDDVEKKLQKDWIKLIFDKNSLLIEQELKLSNFIQYIKGQNGDFTSERTMQTSVGDIIYRKIIQKVDACKIEA